MKDGVFRTLGLTGALAAGLLTASCGPEATGPSLAAPQAQVGLRDPTSFSFNLLGPNTADNASGETIRTTGSGSFDDAAGTIVASGSFTHTTAAGSVVAKGTWEATAFTSFEGFGGPNPGFQGGVLEFVATLFPSGGSPVTGVPMSVTCLVNKPAGFAEDEGTTVGAFAEKTGGATLFHVD